MADRISLAGCGLAPFKAVPDQAHSPPEGLTPLVGGPKLNPLLQKTTVGAATPGKSQRRKRASHSSRFFCAYRTRTPARTPRPWRVALGILRGGRFPLWPVVATHRRPSPFPVCYLAETVSNLTKESVMANHAHGQVAPKIHPRHTLKFLPKPRKFGPFSEAQAQGARP